MDTDRGGLDMDLEGLVGGCGLGRVEYGLGGRMEHGFGGFGGWMWIGEGGVWIGEKNGTRI